MQSVTNSNDGAQVAIRWRTVRNVLLALVLGVVTAIVAHLVAFGLANVGGEISIPAGNVCYGIGEGLAACIYIAVLLKSLPIRSATCFWCWLAAWNLCVMAMPTWSVLFHCEWPLLVLWWTQLSFAVAAWFVWLNRYSASENIGDSSARLA